MNWFRNERVTRLMSFTFGIITTGDGPQYEKYTDQVIQSILSQGIPEDNYEIIVVGGAPRSNVKHISFDDSNHLAWVTRKKNIITENSTKEYIVFLYDYISLEPGWYTFISDHLLSHGPFDVGITRVENKDGSRYIDWVLDESACSGSLWTEKKHHTKYDRGAIVSFYRKEWECLLPYDLPDKVLEYTRYYQYLPGIYWIARKSVMKEYPLNESLNLEEGEDILWSQEVREKYPFTFISGAKVKLLKQQYIKYKEVPPSVIQELKRWVGIFELPVGGY